MLDFSIFKGWNGYWAWEVMDGDKLVIRSDHVFVLERDARDDLMKSTHLIQSELVPISF